MGLKSDIYAAFEKNLGEDNVNATSDGQKKVDELADDLSKAVIAFIQAQKFTITKMNASQQAVPSTPAAVPLITVKIDERGPAPDNAFSGVESMNSEVMLKFIKPDSK